MVKEDEHSQSGLGKGCNVPHEHLIPVEDFARSKGMTALEVIDHIVNDGATYRGLQDERGHWLVDSRSPCDQWWQTVRPEDGEVQGPPDTRTRAPDVSASPARQAPLSDGQATEPANVCAFLTRLLSRK